MARDGSDYDWAGALMIAEHMDDLRYIRSFVDAYSKSMKKPKRRK